ncbi:trehalose-phosphatase [Paraconexibacter antarcticus]|uniref:Trehalose 6-phosphate phosphatase n=1 Tax=Paraconexibacter antarcticus TaxID=2949664 RepID=A0ABY5DSL7_9ACTN|nr:trehalose-phosphatase [Paraconexibacter antarcticus]UTI64450.1 trehalose-phosphatase [Paraconexibacter antarcticus]
MAATSLHDALGPLLADPSAAAVLLDVDGTLAPIVRHADDAHVPEATRRPLITVARSYGFVGCVSGRRAAIARRIVSLGSITYVGNHGSEVLPGGASETEVDEEVAAWTERVRAFAAAELTREDVHRTRVRGEDKEAIAAFHWRGAPDEAAAEAVVEGIAARADGEGFALHRGRKVLEVRPPVALDKGRGIERLLTGRGLRVALYAGDDVTDVDAFAGLRRLVAAGELEAAVCVGVTSDETPDELVRAADLLVDGPAGVRELLTVLADAVRGGAVAPAGDPTPG